MHRSFNHLKIKFLKPLFPGVRASLPSYICIYICIYVLLTIYTIVLCIISMTSHYDNCPYIIGLIPQQPVISPTVGNTALNILLFTFWKDHYLQIERGLFIVGKEGGNLNLNGKYLKLILLLKITFQYTLPYQIKIA